MIKKTLSRRHGSASCFRPPASEPPSTTAGATNLTTCLYHTRLGTIALTWSKTFLGRSVHVHLLSSGAAFRLALNPFLFWKNQGSHKLQPESESAVTVLWDLTRAKFGSGPEPESGFHIAVMLGSELVLRVGDLHPKAAGSGAPPQALVVRREHVHGAKLHRTKTLFGGRTRAVSVECDDSDPDPRLVVRVDDKTVLQVKHLKWKFRGSQRIDVDGQHILLSWDVYNWLFSDQAADGFALFTFRFEAEEVAGAAQRVVVTDEVPAERGWRKKKGLRMKARSASSSSLSSSAASSSACGSVLEWESVEETELKGPTGFSLLVYAWKS